MANSLPGIPNRNREKIDLETIMAKDNLYYGLMGSAQSWLTATLAEGQQRLVICPNSKEVERITEELSFFLKDTAEVLAFPAWDVLPFEFISPQSDLLAQRSTALFKLSSGLPVTIVTSPESLLQKVIPQRILQALTFSISKGDHFTRTEIIDYLIRAGYSVVSLVEEIGDAAIRGNIVDIFCPLYVQPIRIEFVGDLVDDVRFFDAESQRSRDHLSQCTIIPIREFSGQIVGTKDAKATDQITARIKKRASDLEVPPREFERISEAIRDRVLLPGLDQFLGMIYEDACALFSYLKSDARITIIDQHAVANRAEEFSELIEERALRFKTEHRLIPTKSSLYLSASDLNQVLERHDKDIIDKLEVIDSTKVISSSEKISTLTHSELVTKLRAKIGSGDSFAPLVEFVNDWRAKGYCISFIVGSSNRSERLKSILSQGGITATQLDLAGLEWIKQREYYPIAILNGELNEGFRVPSLKIAFVSEAEIFTERSHRHTPSKVKSIKKFMSSLAQLKDGDFIVHMDYGVGLYHGLVHLLVDNKGRDFLHIEYSGETKLYLPIENIGKIQKYVSKEGQAPQLDKLGSQKWPIKKAKVRQAVVALAGELIKLYASRSTIRGWKFDPYGVEDDRFADGFGFEETPDQLQAIKDTLNDMALNRPMDRLICGDAGFGKTEVALRAAFKCIEHGKQVAVLVPTTILAEQHYNVFKNRFAEYPVKVGILSRFYKAKDNAQTLQSLENGKIDIVIGTHKLLQSNVAFKDLGLLIIDEEHRFGVKHKEKLKQLKKNVDVLTLTATPIPRTLHMALLGIREISIITTPPHDRRVIRTYVATQENSLIRDAVLREKQRGGQSFILYNKVQTIGSFTKQIAELVPEVKFEFAHGQMKEAELEKVMLRFLKREIDVLICTTIIESGLDIPNANTIVVTKADQLGLAQLYQLRGRVGRSSKQAYAYLMVPEFKKLGADAQKRLQVLQSLDDLGLGFNLAARDLEIRGAGNLLGKDQSGNVQTVGLDLYNRILKEAILNMRGIETSIADEVDPELRVSVEAYIPQDYIPDISERLILYQRLSDIPSNQVAMDLYYEIQDRFGHMPKCVDNLVQLMRLRSLLRLAGVTRIDSADCSVTLTFSSRAKIDQNKLNNLLTTHPATYRLKGKSSLAISVDSSSFNNPVQLIDPCYKLFLNIFSPFPPW